MASDPLTSWQLDGEEMKTVTDFSVWTSKSLRTVAAVMKLKEEKLLGRKTMTNLDSILKSRDTALLTEDCIVKAMLLPVVLYGCESWTIKKAER